MNILLIGPQGCGKGTLSAQITKDFGLIPISMGDLFRSSIAKNEPLGLKAKEFMDRGELVPLDLTLKLLSERLKQDDCKKGVIFDGFPRNIEQAKELKKIANIDVVIQINLPYEVCIDRILSRRVCSGCGAIYNTHHHSSDVCDKCGKKLVQRDDDKNLDAINTRLEVYEKQTTPLIDFYADRLFVVNGGSTPDVTYNPVKKLLGEKIK